MRPLGIYIHIPFCKTKCDYCDFYSKPCVKADVNEYVKALTAHLDEANLKNTDYEVDTIYFGGGTPTIIGEKNLIKIANAIYKNFKVLKDCETTLEANPNTVTYPMLKKLIKVGFNRISFGVQSSNPFELKELGRTHTFDQAQQAVELARKAGFKNISLDLMYGLPGQSEKTWQRSLEDIAALEPDHISCYALKLEEGTPMCRNAAAYDLPDDDKMADFYLMAVEYLEKAGYRQYEISNFAKPGMESKHNLKYWTMGDYWGFGPSAHSMMGKKRFSYVRDTCGYIDGVLNHDTVVDKSEECNSTSERAGEYLMLALRTVDGICAETVEKKYLTYFDEIEKCLLKYHKYGHVEFDGEKWRLTPKGFLISNTIISEVLIALENSRSIVNKNMYKRPEERM